MLACMKVKLLNLFCIELYEGALEGLFLAFWGRICPKPPCIFSLFSISNSHYHVFISDAARDALLLTITT